MDKFDSLTDKELHDRIVFLSSSVALTMADMEYLADLTQQINNEVLRDIENPQTLRGLVRYVLGVDIPDALERRAHVDSWVSLINDQIDAEISDRRAIKAELDRRAAGQDASEDDNEWSGHDTVDLKLRITREKLTTRFTPHDRAELAKLVERIKRVRRRDAIESGGKFGGATIGESLVIRTLIRIAAGRDLPEGQRADRVGLVVDRVMSALELAAIEREDIDGELYRREEAGQEAAAECSSTSE